MHENGLIHTKLSPERFVIGKNPDDSVLYLVSFDKTLIHGNGYRRETATPVVNFEFMSLAVHRGESLSWKDDLESLCYMLIYFLRGKLPWSEQIAHAVASHKGVGISDVLNQLVYRSKLENPVEKICENLPREINSGGEGTAGILSGAE